MTNREKQIRQIKEQARVEQGISEDLYEQSEQSIQSDVRELSSQRDFQGEYMPDDVYKYKVYRMSPDAKQEFSGLIDKDITLAKYKGTPPDLDYLKFVAETIVLMEKILVVDKEFYVPDEEGQPQMITTIDPKTQKVTRIPKIMIKRVFDDHFEPIVSTFRASIKFLSVGSRALGDDREAILDKTYTLQKGIKRGDSKKRENVIGVGG